MSEADYLEAVEGQALFSEIEGLSTRANTPTTTSEDTISASNNNHNVAATCYVIVTIIESKHPVKNPSILHLQDYGTAQAFREALLKLDHSRSCKKTSTKYTW
ncbi:MAG: hypothetical protein M1835_007553 [Candelina submexicana]|nr:MAG: hypothetical protein M1835_007553 [Candelina submexicana]